MDLDFLKKIKQKLQIGNTLSIHLNSFPGRRATRLDITNLNMIKPGLADEFIKNLISEPKFSLKFGINTDEKIPDEKPHEADNTRSETEKEKKARLGLISKRLTSILYENDDNFLEHGFKTFGFGFPILVYKLKKDPSKVITAPVFIWKLEISRAKNEWCLGKEEDSAITVNEILLNYLEQDLDTSGFFSISDEQLSDSLLDKNEILKLCNNLISQINKDSKILTDFSPLSEIADKEHAKNIIKENDNPYISFSGVLGLFRSQKEAVIKDIKEIISGYEKFSFDTAVTEEYQSIPFSAIETDPTQEAALKSLKSNNKLIIHGPPGTGKSQSLSAIIVNALANNARCLVVCEKRTALEVIKKNLELAGLGELCGLVEDINRDRKFLIDSVRARSYKNESVSENILNNLMLDAAHYIDSINKGHLFYDKKLINEDNWTCLVGKYLHLTEENVLFDRMYKELKSINYNFETLNLSEEFNNRGDLIKQDYNLYTQSSEKLQVFKTLNDKLFKDTSSKDIVFKLKEFLEEKILMIRGYISDGSAILKKYTSDLENHYSQYNTNLNQILEEIHSVYSRNEKSNLFKKLNGFTEFKLNFFKIFSGNLKSIKKDKIHFIELGNKLGDILSYHYLDIDYKQPVTSLNEVYLQAADVKARLDIWYNMVNNLVNENASVFSQTVYNNHAVDNINPLKDFDTGLLKLPVDLNASDFFNVKFEFQKQTLSFKLEYLYEIEKTITGIIQNFSSLYPYSLWRNHYVNQDLTSQKIIDSLIEVNSANWNIDFVAWFIFNVLLTYETKIEFRNDNQINSLEDNLIKIKKYQVESIKNNWRQKQQEASSNFEKKNGINLSLLYNKAKNNRFEKKNSLRKIIKGDFELFTNHFPVLLLNPVNCSSLFDMNENLFDLVIFDEASQLRIEDVFAAQLRGRYKIVSGDENQMPPSNYFTSSKILIDSENTDDEDADENEFNAAGLVNSLADSESLLEYSLRSGFKETHLDIHYRSRHPDLIRFSNAAFYNSRLKPVPPLTDYKAIRYIQMDALYDNEEGVNKDEAAKVLQLIDELTMTTDGSPLKSIGIATFNIFQRNYILDLIGEKADRNPIFAQKINALKEIKGEEFFVKNLENIQGDERDIIIISTTFGKRNDGTFLQNFGPITSEKGFRLLNVIITRAKYNVIVCTSIPENKILEYSTKLPATGNKGNGVFYAYLAYAKAIEANNIAGAESVIDLLSRNNDNNLSTQNITQSIFEDEVVSMLAKKINPDRIITQYELAGFKIDIAVKSQRNSKVTIAIECDGAKYHSSSQSYAWDRFRQKFLENYGLKFIRIWSVDWWNNPDRELEKLVEFINNHSV